jgi:hypothetical protein
MAGDYVLGAHDNQNYFDQQGVNGERTGASTASIPTSRST